MSQKILNCTCILCYISFGRADLANIKASRKDEFLLHHPPLPFPEPLITCFYFLIYVFQAVPYLLYPEFFFDHVLQNLHGYGGFVCFLKRLF
jgi:hypothetical protein